MRIVTILTLIICFLFTPASPTLAQSAEQAKAEAFVGYMYKRNGEENFNGINVSGVYNFSKYVGAKIDYSNSGGPEYFPYGRQTERTVMAGIQVKNRTKEMYKARPFMHALIGSSRQTLFGPKTNALTYAVGGGLDVRVSDHFSIRTFQADFQPTFHNSVTRLQLRFSFGVVID